jgi:23S rRNA A2030 N6-methylase RlmJ
VLLRSQGVGTGSLASEKCLRTGESQAGLRRTLCLIQEMLSSLCHFLDDIVLLRAIQSNSVSLLL